MHDAASNVGAVRNVGLLISTGNQARKNASTPANVSDGIFRIALDLKTVQKKSGASMNDRCENCIHFKYASQLGSKKQPAHFGLCSVFGPRFPTTTTDRDWCPNHERVRDADDE